MVGNFGGGGVKTFVVEHYSYDKFRGCMCAQQVNVVNDRFICG